MRSLRGHILKNIAAGKVHSCVAERFCDLRAFCHHACLAIHTVHCDLTVQHGGKIMIHGKTEIALSAAKIRYIERSGFWQSFGRVPDVFRKPTNLTEFGLFFVVDSAIRVRNIQSTEKGLRTSQQSVFIAIVALCTRLYSFAAGTDTPFGEKRDLPFRGT